MESYVMAQYKIIFKGESLDSDVQTTTAKLEKFLKITNDKAVMLLNGKAYALKKNLPAETAIDLQTNLLKIGIVTHLVREVEVAPEITYQESVENGKTANDDSNEPETAYGQLSVTVDIWYALKTMLTVHLGITVIAFYSLIYYAHELPLNIWLAIFLINGLFVPLTIKVYSTYAKGYVADIANNEFSFPASDVENSLVDIITLKQLRNMINRETIALSDIRALNNEKGRGQKYNPTTKRNVGFDIWKLNISGEFGSRQFVFHSKQKRDECRSMIYTACYRVGNKLRGASDLNLDL